MGTTYFGFAVSDSMFAGNCTIARRVISADEARVLANAPETVHCFNPSHTATIAAAQSRFGMNLRVPPAPPRVSLGVGDSLVVMQVSGLPRLTDRHEYTAEEIASARFTFSLWTIG